MVAWDSTETDSVYHNPGDKITPATDSVITLIGLKRYKVFHGYPRQVGGVDSLAIASNTNTLFDPRVTGYAPDGLLWYFRLGNSSILFGHDADVSGGMTNYPVSGLSRTSTALSTHMTNSVGWTFGAGSNLNRSYHYDLDNRLDEIMVGSPVARQLVFGYDALGQLTSQETRSGCSLISSDSTSGYNYSCPTLLSSQIFAYDSMGNRRDLGGAPTTGNRYAAFNGANYTYDADGNLIHKNKVGVYDIYYYWNALNQLDSVVNNGYRTQFEYNAFDKPVRVKEGSSYPLQVQRYLLWDGENLLAQLDTAGQRGVDYGYLPGALDHPIAYEHGPTWPPSMAFVDVDEAGNVIGSVEAGSLRQDNSYDAWGAVTSNMPTDQSLYWKGLFWNGANTGLYYMRNRWYDPESGRFLSEDPAGFAGGDNLYAFAGNDPINGQDASGLGDCRWVVHSTITVSGVGPTVTTTNGNWVCFPSPSYPGATNSNPIPAGPTPGLRGGSAGAQSLASGPRVRLPSAACVMAWAQFGLAFGETAAIGVEATAALIVGESVAAAADAVATGALNALVRQRRVYLRHLPGRAVLNSNATVAKTMLGHFGLYGEGKFAAASVGEGFGIGDYIQDLTPGWNVYRGIRRIEGAC